MPRIRRDRIRPRSRDRRRHPGSIASITALVILLGTGAAFGVSTSGALAHVVPSITAQTAPVSTRSAPGPAAGGGSTAHPAAVPSTPNPSPRRSVAARATPAPTPTRRARTASPETTGAQQYGRFALPLSRNPDDLPSQQLRAQRATASPTTLGLLEKIARNPIADWYGGSTTSVQRSVAYRVQAAAKQRAVAQLVVYNLPNRDCEGGYSASTLTAPQYRTWFRTFVDGLGTRKAIVILEPDALMQISCLTAAQRSERYGLLSWATALLHRQGSWTYLDAGHSAGLPATTAAARLRRAGVADAAGFSLNVSGFRGDTESIAYGTAISSLVGGKHFVVDSSRNGVEPRNADWCNPSGKGLGRRPTGATGVHLLDAYLWVKTPGASDGTCSGGPASGAWWQPYALMLARNGAPG